MSVLTQIQAELKAPKNRYNSFGEFRYRSCEDILEAVKPLLLKYDASLTIRDEMVDVGGRIYVKAIAMLKVSDMEPVEVTAFAREPEDKKKMDSAQITGTESSYARKYALNGLLLIDDARDPDTNEYVLQTNETVANQKIGKVKGEALTKAVAECGKDIKTLLDYYKVATAADLTEAQHAAIMKKVRDGNNR